MAIPVWVDGNPLPASDVNNWMVPLVAYRTNTQSLTSNAVLQNDNTLFVAVAANAVYLVELVLKYEAATAADIQIGWTFPAGAANVNTVTASMTGGAAVFTDDQMIAGVSVPTFGGLGAGQALGAYYRSILTTAGTAGTFQLQWAQAVSNATATIVHAGSSLLLQRVG